MRALLKLCCKLDVQCMPDISTWGVETEGLLAWATTTRKIKPNKKDPLLYLQQLVFCKAVVICMINSIACFDQQNILVFQTKDLIQLIECLPAGTESWDSAPKHHINWASWCTPVISALRKWEQEDQKFKVILFYITNSGQPGIDQTLSQNQQEQQRSILSEYTLLFTPPEMHKPLVAMNKTQLKILWSQQYLQLCFCCNL